jgi:hypothetical protein
MSDTPQLLLAHHLKALKLPTFLREYDKLAQQCAAEGVDHPRYLLRLAELELIDRERRMVERRIKEARFPTVKSLDSFDFTAIPSLNKTFCSRIGVGCLPEGLVSRLHHRGRYGPRADRGQGREATAPPTAPAGRLQAADRR